MLLTLSGQRLSTLYHFRIDLVQSWDRVAIFNVTALLKQGKASRKKEPIIFHAYPHDEHLCPVTVPPRMPFLSPIHGKPHHAATKDTLARWAKDMFLGGVDTAVFHPHSCRSASSSTAKASGVLLHKILHSGQWVTESTFYKFYQHQNVRSDITINKDFADSILADKLCVLCIYIYILYFLRFNPPLVPAFAMPYNTVDLGSMPILHLPSLVNAVARIP